MNAGRELDALIAEKVMGIAVQKDQITRGMFYAKKPDDRWDYFIGDSNDLIPKYSTDIAAAWEVVERLKQSPFRERDLTLEISVSAEYPDETEASVKWLDAEQGHGPFYLLGKTAPHAIALAALKAVGA